MYYCESCRVANAWPESPFRSYGPCEVCDQTAACNDMPSRALPTPPAPLDPERIAADDLIAEALQRAKKRALTPLEYEQAIAALRALIARAERTAS